MNSRTVLGCFLQCSAMLFLLPLPAWADFIIELRDGRQVIVRHYVEEAETIRIYTAYGTIGFRRVDVKQISQVEGNIRLLLLPLEQEMSRPGVPAQADRTAESEEAQRQAAAEGSAEGQKEGAGKKSLSPAEIEQIDQDYQLTDRTYEGLSEKYTQAGSGASNEELEEYQRELSALDEERQTLRKKVREEANPQDFPAWMR